LIFFIGNYATSDKICILSHTFGVLMKKRAVIIGFFLFIIIYLGCQKDTVQFIDIVAKVDDQYLTNDELLNLLPENLTVQEKGNISKQFIDYWIQRTVLEKSAQNEGLVLSQHEKWIIRNLETEMMADKFIELQLPERISISDEEIQKYYENNQEEFIRDQEEVHLVQLFLEKSDPAISREIQTSDSLLEVITKNYLDLQTNRLMEKNGDLGYIAIQNLRPDIRRRIQNSTVGRIYGPVTLENSNFYYQVLDKQPSGSIKSIDLVKESVRMRLILQKRESLIEDIANESMKNYDVEIFPEHIK
jgi:hypothetical protein